MSARTSMSLRGWLAAALLLPVLAVGYMAAEPGTLPVKLRMALLGEVTERLPASAQSFWLTPAVAAIDGNAPDSRTTVVFRSGGEAPVPLRVASTGLADDIVASSLPGAGIAYPLVATVKKTDRYLTPLEPDKEKDDTPQGEEPQTGAGLYLTSFARELTPYAMSMRSGDEELKEEREAAAAASRAGKGVSYRGESEAEFQERERRCLATAIYFEARGEPITGQKAVAQVVMNRVRSPEYPDTICGVVYQGQHLRTGCQFSFTCDGKTDNAKDEERWAIAVDLARKTTANDVWLDDIGHATHYHANYVSPRWIREMKRIQSIGAHIFYKLRNEKPYEVTPATPAESPAKGLAFSRSG